MNETDHFYNICSQGLESAKLGQYGPEFTPKDLRNNLEEQALSFDINWGEASKTPFTMISPGVEIMNQYIDQAVSYFQGWLDTKAGA